jgi:predicted restriction endonuclease
MAGGTLDRALPADARQRTAAQVGRAPHVYLGYLSVDTRYRLQVSSRLRAEFGNGEAFYAKEGKVITLPDRRGDQPNVDFLQWRMEAMFKAS